MSHAIPWWVTMEKFRWQNVDSVKRKEGKQAYADCTQFHLLPDFNNKFAIILR